MFDVNLKCALAFTLGAAQLVSGAANAQLAASVSQEERAAPTVATSNTAHARRAAQQWTEDHPADGAAVAVYMGTQGGVTPAQIEQVMRRDFAAAGVLQVVFFYEQNNTPGTGFSLHGNGSAYGPYNLQNVRQNISAVAGQITLAQSNPAFRYKGR